MNSIIFYEYMIAITEIVVDFISLSNLNFLEYVLSVLSFRI
ncbi:hypothetical protein LEP1GSC062_3299 [Leptospira alexanderi serovar Manhao 3 str. L 60]|uniref:Uncharacterized protein n=1 Tax=Leptospira alexanderi serovar Manhao 3 str. L 60 TaxID=1049759 RepID=V6I7I8_9LEPT|nr:hypothetical protein LEP1GSC062_3299 [Leptospira alexanderi serovar Manhao 3 str. L 60]